MWFAMPRGADARAALALSWVVLAYLVIQVVVSLSSQQDATLAGTRRLVGITLAVVTAVGFLRLQALVLRDRHPRWYGPLRWGLVATGVVLLPLSDAWAMFGISLATLLLTSTRTQVLGVGLALTVLVEVALRDASAEARIGIPMVCWLAAGVVYVLTRLALALEELRAAREHLARLQVDEERHRISRDLHDILGRTLVAASLRTQTALRLLDADTCAARGQLEQAAQTLSDGQAQLRALVSGTVIVGLDSEIATAVDLFRRIGIDCEVDAAPVASEEHRGVAAAVLREAVTNMLKHSRPSNAWVSVREEASATLVSVVNDGAPEVPRGDGGTGLRELAQRVEAAGGTLQAGEADGARFRVIARLPHVRAPQGAASTRRAL